MNLLSQIIERLNQRIGAGNIFDQIYGLSELSADGNDKAWVHYIGNGQAVPVTNFDAHQATIFWAKRGKITVQKVDSIKLSGCKALYETKFTLSAYAVARKSHLPCDAADAQDWLASRVLRLVSGTDPLFKTSIGVVSYEVIPNGYANEVKSLTANYEFACVTIDVDVNVVSPSEDGCYDTCGSGDIPLPDLIPCTPCLTEVAVDGVTITGNGTEADPLVAIGGGGGGGILVALPFSNDHLTATGNPYTIGNVVWYLGNVYRCIANNDSILPTNAAYWVNLGAGFQAVERPADWNATTGNNQILNKPTIPAAQVNSDWNASSGVAEILNKPTIPVLPATIVEDVTATSPIFSSGGATPDISIQPANLFDDGYLTSADFTSFYNKFDVPTGTASDYLDGTGTPTLFPTIPAAQVNSDWNAVSGVAEILNKPTIPAAQIQSDWNQANNAALDFIKNKPTIPTGTVTSVNAGTNISVTGTATDPIINSLSDRYKTTSTTSNSVSNGSKSFTVDLNLSYIPLQEILVVHNPANHMHGEVTSYNAATGALVVDIKTHTGSGTYTAWTLNLDGTPVDALTGSGTANEIAYFTAARVLASLPVATYPSLTELSYVKGVTSAIQTQINGKFNTPSGTTAQYVRGDGSLATFPSLPLIYKDVNNQTAVTGNTNNNKVVSVLIPANTITVGAIVEIKARVGKTGGAGITTLRVYANTADSIVTPAPTLVITSATASIGQVYNGMDRSAIVKSATVTQTAQANASIQTDASVGNATLTNSNIDWTVNQYLIFAIQNGSAADSTVLSYYQIEIK
jgi:hypothetical protein